MKRFFIKSVACISIAFFLATFLPNGFYYTKVLAATKTAQENADLLMTGNCDSFGGRTIIGTDCYYAQRDQAAIKILADQAISSRDKINQLTAQKASATSPMQAQAYQDQIDQITKDAATAKKAAEFYGGNKTADQITVDTANKVLNDLRSKLDEETDPAKKAQIQSQITQTEGALSTIQAAIADKEKIGPVNDCGKLDLGCHLNFFFSTILPQALMGMVIKIFNIILWAIVKILAFILWASAALLDLSLDFTMRIGEKSALIASMKQTWVVLRDTFNILFIFILLYISIQTILKGAAAKTKQMLANVVIAALLINFSLLITNTIIDASNIFTISIYNQSQPTGQNVTLSTNIMKSLSLQTLEKDPLPMESIGFTMRSFIQIILYSVVIWAFVQSMLLMMVRTIMFFVLMALSPIGFMGDVIPRIGEYSKKWWSTLTDQALVGPIFMFFMLIIVNLINSGVLKNSLISAGSMVSGESFGSISGSFLNVFIIIGFIITAVKVSKKLSGDVGAYVSGLGGKIAGALTVGGGALLARNVIGRGAAALMNNEKVKDKLGSNPVGRLALRGTEKVAKSSFDVRNTELGKSLNKQGLDLGKAGGKDGFIGQAERSQKRTIATAKLLETDINSGEGQARIEKAVNKMKAEKAIDMIYDNGKTQKINEKNQLKEQLNKLDADIKGANGNNSEEENQKINDQRNEIMAKMQEKEKEIVEHERKRGEEKLKLKERELTEKEVGLLKELKFEDKELKEMKSKAEKEVKTSRQSAYANAVEHSIITRITSGKKGMRQTAKKIRDDLVKGKSDKDKLVEIVKKMQKDEDQKEEKKEGAPAEEKKDK